MLWYALMIITQNLKLFTNIFKIRIIKYNDFLNIVFMSIANWTLHIEFLVLFYKNVKLCINYIII